MELESTPRVKPSQVNGERHTAKYICVATGGRATRLPIPGKNLPGAGPSENPRIRRAGGGGFSGKPRGFYLLTLENMWGSEQELWEKKRIPFHSWGLDHFSDAQAVWISFFSRPCT